MATLSITIAGFDTANAEAMSIVQICQLRSTLWLSQNADNVVDTGAICRGFQATATGQERWQKRKWRDAQHCQNGSGVGKCQSNVERRLRGVGACTMQCACV